MATPTRELKICYNHEDDEEEEAAAHQQSDLPHDVITDHILIRLPIKPLLRFKSVSKHWYATLSSYQFATTHFKSSPFGHPSSSTQCILIKSGMIYNLYCYKDDDDDDEKFDAFYGRNGFVRVGVPFDVMDDDDLCLLGSCNGLVCLASLAGYLIIWNPITSQWRKIIAPSYPLKHFHEAKCKASWGFGYVSSVDDYKVVRILEISETLEILIHVFSFRTNTWKKIDAELYESLFSLKTTWGYQLWYDHINYLYYKYARSFQSNVGVLVDETLYWIVAGEVRMERYVVAFDLVSETFDKFPGRELRHTDFYEDKFLCTMGGFLCSCGVNIRNAVFITVLNGPSYGMFIGLHEGLCLDDCEGLVGFTRTNKFFIQTRGRVGLVDPKTRPVKYRQLVTYEGQGEIHIANHVPTMIPPPPIAGLQE